MKLIDLHCHILPGVDDGAQDMQMALTLAKAAVDEDISHILVTPHHMDGVYLNHRQDVIEHTAAFQNELAMNQIPLVVFPGQEVHLTGQLPAAIEASDILFMDETDRYLLLELPHSGVPEYTNKMLFDLIAQGITPVLAHPERNAGFQKDPNKLYDLVKMGCLTQITASSYLGVFGSKVQQLTEKIVKADQGYIFASDAHNFEGRRFLMKEAFSKLANEEGQDKAKLFNENAKNIINGDDVVRMNSQKITKVPKKKRFWLF
ncbi:tyrosine-protein phosphatase [Companilactobacillus furfuricola]|uniref:tyrosine-protein phosphatase n=1 Tax=Companilactobacillus furfuricola TaxID=1462575 RepID=UPI000F7B0293|nr:CpsB/CapC family capsule biosynthesis tyrosine phosphatase [Companilactobacillus furfuricola]